MAFKFGLELVLKHRKREEDLAQREFALARQAVDLCLQQINQMYKQIDSTREEIGRFERSGRGEDLEMVRESLKFVDGQKIRIHDFRMKARELIRNLEEKEELLLQRLHDRKIMEQLKERRFQEYKDQLIELEKKELDDLTTSRFAGRRK